VLQAPFRSGITIEDYQLDPVVRALTMPRANLLIADDVGLGKTIEAGLVVQELLLRHRARTVLVVCPAGLTIKWEEEMRDRFGLEFRIVNTDAVRELRRDRGVGANVFTSFPRLIVSIDWLKDHRAQSLLDEVLAGVDHRRTPRTFDLLIVDEVHSAAPSGRGLYAVDSLRTLVLGASNLWFSSSVSVLSLPVGGGSLAQLVYDHWDEFQKMTVKDVLGYALGANRTLQAAFVGFDVDEIWDAVEARRAGGHAPQEADVLGPEWAALTAGAQGEPSPHFEADPIPPPEEFRPGLAGVTLAHRLRVVTALCGFTRISAPEPDEHREVVALETTGAPKWVPVVENRGEGIFVRLDEAAVQAWEARAVHDPVFVALHRAHRDWREARGLDPGVGWPGERYVLLHSLSHALINELAIECGYSAASISERIYSRRPGEGPEPMAGILLYTSAPDAEGTLGGLVNLGRASELGPVLRQALERAGLCSSDPLCADHEPDAAMSALHGAACHACLLVAETSCERGNRYLDRATLVETFRRAGMEYFA